MDEEIREKFMQAVEQSFQSIGANDYEQGIIKAQKLIAFVSQIVDAMPTKDHLRAVLASLPIPPEQEESLLQLGARLPQLLRAGLKQASKKATSTLPPQSGRPRATTSTEAQKLLGHIFALIQKGHSVRMAKDRAAQKYGLSRRTVDRIWADRACVPKSPPSILEIFMKLLDTHEH